MFVKCCIYYDPKENIKKEAYGIKKHAHINQTSTSSTAAPWSAPSFNKI